MDGILKENEIIDYYKMWLYDFVKDEDTSCQKHLEVVTNSRLRPIFPKNQWIEGGLFVFRAILNEIECNQYNVTPILVFHLSPTITSRPIPTKLTPSFFRGIKAPPEIELHKEEPGIDRGKDFKYLEEISVQLGYPTYYEVKQDEDDNIYYRWIIMRVH